MNDLVAEVLTIAMILELSMTGQIVSETTEPTLLTTYLREDVTAEFNYTGEVLSETREGHADVIVPNVGDVLQQVVLNISSTTGTNLQNVKMYRNFVKSTGEKTRVYANTSADSQSSTYNITDSDTAPTINLSLTHNNSAGGIDLYSNDNSPESKNTIYFNLSIQNPSSSRTLNDVEARVEFEKDTVGGNDVVNITSNSSSGGSTDYTNRSDTDGDGFYDAVYWKGNIPASTTVVLSFNATVEEGVNYGQSENWLDLDYGVSRVEYGNDTAVHTQKTLAQNFTRAAIQEGIDMAQNTSTYTWMIRGFIESRANETENNLTYTVHDWKIYQVDTSGYNPMDSPNLSYSGSDPWKTLYPGDREYTDWFDTGLTDKPFYASSFDWEVDWEGNHYYSLINCSMRLPLLNEVDIGVDKNLTSRLYAEVANTTATVNDTVQYLGNDSLKGEYLEVLSYVPNQDQEGDVLLFDINESSVGFYYINSTSEYEIDRTVTSNFTVTEPSTSAYGLVNLTISNVSNVTFTSGEKLGRDLGYDSQGVGEYIRMSFDVLSNASMLYNDRFNFTGNSTLKTGSGTPVTEQAPVRQASMNPMCSLNLNTNQQATGPEYLDNTSEGLQFGSVPIGYVATPRRVVAYANTSASVFINISINATDWECNSGDCLSPLPGTLSSMPVSTTRYINSSSVTDNSSHIDSSSEYNSVSGILSSDLEGTHNLTADTGASTWYNILIPEKTSSGVYQQNITYYWSCD